MEPSTSPLGVFVKTDKLFLCFLLCSWSFLSRLPVTSAYALGAPEGSCEEMNPQHQTNVPQTTDPPYSLQVTSNSNSYDLVLSPTDPAEKIKGYFFQVRKVGEKEAVGTFSGGAETKTLDCNGNAKSGATHAGNDEKSSVTVNWIPPQVMGMAEYQVYYTVVKDFATYWTLIPHPDTIKVDIKSVPSSSESPVSGPPPPSTLLEKWRKIYGNCGKTKGCFGLPSGCVEKYSADSDSPKTCKMLVTWSRTGKENLFEITGKPDSLKSEGQGYVAMGLSTDKDMGDDSVVGCALAKGETTPKMERSYNTGRPNLNNKRHSPSDLGVKPVSASYLEGNLFCEFVQTDHDVTGITVTFDKTKYYYMLSNGPYSSTDPGLSRHPKPEDKGVTDVPVLITDIGNLEAAEDTLWLVSSHGTMMLFTWLVFVPLGTFMARYFRNTCTSQTFFGKHFWLAAHVTCMVAASVFTVVGMSFIVVKEKGFNLNNPHAILGVVVNILSVFQVISPLFRNASWAPSRKIFGWGHFLMASLIFNLAYICIFLANDLPVAQLKDHQTAFIGVFVTTIFFQIVVHAVMTYHTYQADGEMEVETEFRKRAFSLGPIGTNGKLEDAPGAGFRYSMLGVFVGGLFILALVMGLVVFHKI